MNKYPNLDRLYNLNTFTCEPTQVLNLISSILDTSIKGHQTSINYKKLPVCVKQISDLNKILLEFCIYYASDIDVTYLSPSDAKYILNDFVRNKRTYELIHKDTSKTVIQICAEILKDEYPELYAASLINCNDQTLLNVYKSKIATTVDYEPLAFDLV